MDIIALHTFPNDLLSILKLDEPNGALHSQKTVLKRVPSLCLWIFNSRVIVSLCFFWRSIRMEMLSSFKLREFRSKYWTAWNAELLAISKTMRCVSNKSTFLRFKSPTHYRKSQGLWTNIHSEDFKPIRSYYSSIESHANELTLSFLEAFSPVFVSLPSFLYVELITRRKMYILEYQGFLFHLCEVIRPENKDHRSANKTIEFSFFSCPYLQREFYDRHFDLLSSCEQNENKRFTWNTTDTIFESYFSCNWNII